MTPVIIKAELDDGSVEEVTVTLADKAKTLDQKRMAIGVCIMDLSKNGIFAFHRDVVTHIPAHRILKFSCTIPSVILDAGGRPQ